MKLPRERLSGTIRHHLEATAEVDGAQKPDILCVLVTIYYDDIEIVAGIAHYDRTAKKYEFRLNSGHWMRRIHDRLGPVIELAVKRYEAEVLKNRKKREKEAKA